MAISIEQIKDIRAKTGAGVNDIKQALEEANGDETKALVWLKEKGLATVAKKADRATGAGLIEVYAHGGRIGSMIEVKCETDFVARNDDFKTFVHDVALQVASMNPKDVDELLAQEFFKDPSKTIQDYLNEIIAKIRENIKISRISRFELGE